MRDSPVHSRMLGGFSIAWNGREISDTDNRMRKVWLLLAYLICRRTSASQEEIIDLLWARSEDRANPAGALKNMFYRARPLLNQLGDSSGSHVLLSLHEASKSAHQTHQQNRRRNRHKARLRGRIARTLR